MFIEFPFQLDSHIIVKRIAKYKKYFATLKIYNLNAVVQKL